MNDQTTCPMCGADKEPEREVCSEECEPIECPACGGLMTSDKSICSARCDAMMRAEYKGEQE